MTTTPLLALLFLSDLSIPLLAWAGYQRRRILRHATPWIVAAALSMTLSVWGYTASIFLKDPELKKAAFLVAITTLNFSGVFASGFVLRLTLPWPRWAVYAAAAYLALLGVFHIPLFVQIRTLEWGVRSLSPNLVIYVPLHFPWRFARAILTWIPLLIAVVATIVHQLRGLSTYQGVQIVAYLAGLLAPYLLWIVDLIRNQPGSISLMWANMWFSALVWILALYWGRLGQIPLVTPDEVLEYSDSGVLVFSWPEQNLIWWNPRVASWFGLANERPALPGDLLARLPVLLKEERARQIHLNLASGPRVFEVRSVPLVEEGQTVARALLLHDVTEAEETRREMERQLVLAAVRENLLEHALTAPSLDDLARYVVQRLAQPWPDFFPAGCALYMRESSDASAPPRARLVAAFPKHLPWQPQHLGDPQSWMPLEEAPVVHPEALSGPHVVCFTPLYLGPEEPWWGYLAWVVPEEQGPARQKWDDAIQDLAVLISYLLRSAQERQHQVLLEAAFKAVPAPILLLNREGKLRIWNQAVEKVVADLGLSWERLLQAEAPFLDVWFGFPLWRQILEGLQARGYWSQTLLQKRGGRTYYWWIAAFPVDSTKGGVGEVGVVVSDLYELEQARQAAQAQREFLERLLHAARVMWESLPSINRLLTETLRLLRTWYPQAHVSLVLVDQDEMGRMYVTTWLRESGLQAVPPFFHRVLYEGAMGWALRHQRCLYLPDVTQAPHWSERDLPGVKARSALVAPMLYRNRPLGVLVVGHPQPERFSDADQQLVESVAQWLALALYNARLYEDESRLQRLHERAKQEVERLFFQQERLFRYLSYELKTPLQAFASFLQQMRAQPPEDGLVLEVLEHLYHAVEDMLATLNHYLEHQVEMITEEVGNIQTFRVEELLQEVRHILRPLLERYEVTMEHEVHPTGLEMTQDRARLRRVLQYLAELGVRRSQGGQVVLRAFYDPETVPPGVVFWILDTGEPVEPEQVERLLNEAAGRTVSSSLPLVFRAQQINLAVVQELIRKLQAKLQVRTVTGFGLAFWLWVPREAGSGAGVARSSST